MEVEICHNLYSHTGSDEILTFIRTKFWVIRDKSVRKNNNNCTAYVIFEPYRQITVSLCFMYVTTLRDTLKCV